MSKSTQFSVGRCQLFSGARQAGPGLLLARLLKRVFIGKRRFIFTICVDPGRQIAKLLRRCAAEFNSAPRVSFLGL